MSDVPPEEESLTNAFHKLGQSLVDTVQAVWDIPERKKIQSEIEEGLTDLSETLKQEVDTFQQSPTGQQLKEDIDGFTDRVRTGETEAQMRQELTKVLNFASTELEKAATILRRSETSDEPEASGTEASGTEEE